jgi:hypothetical protein
MSPFSVLAKRPCGSLVTSHASYKLRCFCPYPSLVNEKFLSYEGKRFLFLRNPHT